MTDIVDVDARRLLCPMPVIRLQDSISRLSPGGQIKITCTDPGVMNDIPAWSRLNGHRVIFAEEQDEEFILVVEKSDDGT